MALTTEGKERLDRCKRSIPHSPRYYTAPTRGCDCYWCKHPTIWTPEGRAKHLQEGRNAETNTGGDASAGAPVAVSAVGDLGPGEVLIDGVRVGRESGGF
jgi:hypothetical protein